jgi:anti-anti-sigma factor
MAAEDPPLLEIVVSFSPDDGTPVVALKGELDLVSRELVQTRLTELTEAGPPRLVLDLTSLTFVDSSGLNVFATIHRRMLRYGGILEAKHMSEPVRKVMEISGLASLLRHPTSQSTDAAGDG